VNGRAGNKSVTRSGQVALLCSALRISRRPGVATHNAAIRKVFLLERFQISLPRNRNAIMLRANWRLPGGRAATYPREMPP
jgi:hypothetical protein